MKQKFFLLMVICLLITMHPGSIFAAGNTSEFLQPLKHALNIYKAKGVKHFINALVKNGPLEGHQDMQLQYSVLEKIEKFYGDYLSTDIIHTTKLTNSTHLIYITLNYEKGPVFGKLLSYKNSKVHNITSFNFHTKPEKIFPELLLVGGN